MMSVGTPLMWVLFAAFVPAALIVDFLAMRNQGAHKVTVGAAAHHG
jgi:tellurite resistance protein TerC